MIDTLKEEAAAKDKDGKNIKCKRQAVHKGAHQMQCSI